MPKPESFTRDTAKVVVSIKGVDYEGWLQSEVNRSLEAICGTFSIPVSLTPGDPPPIDRQDEVKVRIGDQVVINGYVIAAEPFYRKGDCGLRITGRDRAGDLVRSTAIHKGGQWRKATLDRICKDLLLPFDVALSVETDVGKPIEDFKLYHGEPVLDALARAARLRGVLVTSDNAGRLVLTKAGKNLFKGAIVMGQNVIEMQGLGTDEQRHSEYIVYGQRNTVEDFETARGLKGRAVDKEMKRHQPLVINADGNTTADELQRLAEHTMRVRWGHSQGFRYMVEGWTYQGTPWPLNERVAVYDPVAGMDGEKWLICSVRQTCSLQDGDVTELVIRPVEAYDTVPLQTKPHRKNWGNRGNRTNHPPR